MSQTERAPRHSPSVDYGNCSIKTIGENSRLIEAKVIDESDVGLGFICLNDSSPNEGERILINDEHEFTVLWSKAIDGNNCFGIKL